MGNIFNIICIVILFLMLINILWLFNIHLEDQKKIAIIFEKHVLKTNEILEEIRDKLKYKKDAKGLLEELQIITYYVKEIRNKPYHDKQSPPINNDTST